jgi:hypothetical protein
LRDNGTTHPLIEARRNLESELDAARAKLRRDGRLDDFRAAVSSLNREVKLFNLRSPLPNFHLHTVDIEREIIDLLIHSRKTDS